MHKTRVFENKKIVYKKPIWSLDSAFLEHYPCHPVIMSQNHRVKWHLWKPLHPMTTGNSSICGVASCLYGKLWSHFTLWQQETLCFTVEWLHDCREGYEATSPYDNRKFRVASCLQVTYLPLQIVCVMWLLFATELNSQPWGVHHILSHPAEI